MQPRIRIISVGGTISSAEKDNALSSPTYAGEEIIKLVPGIEEYGMIEVENFSKVLSSQLSVEQIFNLSMRIHDIFEEDPELTGIVVTHGTGTLEESAFMADLMVDDSRPVVFTGAMRSLSDPFTDGPFNILNAVRIAVSENAMDKGVMVALNSVIHPASEVYKSHTTNADTFNSGEFGPLGYVYPDRIHFARTLLAKPKINTQRPNFNVDLIKYVVGMDDRFIRASIASGAKGMIIEASGLGNVNDSLADGIELALQKGIVVVISSRCTNGRVYPSYGTKAGGGSLLEKGCILTSMSGPKARMMLMLCLGESMKHMEVQHLFDPEGP
ncbi:L-asparaginase [Pullulanibacillus pueri]|uniref:L-asparaginase n=1 Tax=Pullulanibacillus pueri TaxID=1437324 RepID=A0A8J3EPL2_9BACL|nr:asparaginase [Pullulanibacillus pueri]MBM7684091.1 L-asparaginase [Pullulanibacillus pueri]GGH88630.1 L-asparaginase [Pullulanibacillus pueri]